MSIFNPTKYPAPAAAPSSSTPAASERITFTDVQQTSMISDGSLTAAGKAAVFRRTGTTAAELTALFETGDVDQSVLLLAGVPVPAAGGKTVTEITALSPATAHATTSGTQPIVPTVGQTVYVTVPQNQGLRWHILSPESTATPPVSPNAEEFRVALTAQSRVQNPDGTYTYGFTTKWIQLLQLGVDYPAMAAGAYKALIRFESYAG